MVEYSHGQQGSIEGCRETKKIKPHDEENGKKQSLVHASLGTWSDMPGQQTLKRAGEPPKAEFGRKIEKKQSFSGREKKKHTVVLGCVLGLCHFCVPKKTSQVKITFCAIFRSMCRGGEILGGVSGGERWIYGVN